VTYDVVVLCERQPDAGATLGAFRACGPSLLVNVIDRGALVQLCDAQERPLVTVEGARLVLVPGEAQRLLGIEAELPHPVWWVEARAVRSAPDAPRIARRFAAALLSVTGGVSWSSR